MKVKYNYVGRCKIATKKSKLMLKECSNEQNCILNYSNDMCYNFNRPMFVNRIEYKSDSGKVLFSHIQQLGQLYIASLHVSNNYLS